MITKILTKVDGNVKKVGELGSEVVSFSRQLFSNMQLSIDLLCLGWFRFKSEWFEHEGQPNFDKGWWQYKEGWRIRFKICKSLKSVCYIFLVQFKHSFYSYEVG